MSLLDKILYVADYIEPRRDKAPNLPKLRRLAFEDLDEALYQILDSTRNYLKETGTAEDDTTEQTWEYSVSYTHLDVYKRQRWNCRVRRARNKRIIDVKKGGGSHADADSI